MNVIRAIRISTSVPLYFTPIQFDNKLWVDGGIIDNYPIHLFKNKLNTTLGVYLNENREFTDIKNLEDYFSCVMQSLMEGLSIKSILGFENNTIIIKSATNNILDTNFSKETILDFINSGYKTATNFLI